MNAYAIGYEDPFIVMTSGALELLESDDERRFLLAHELGHIMSDHMTLRTIAMVILSIGSLALMPIGLALLPFQLGLLEWHRKSELSSDRAALLAIQDKLVAQGTFMRLAGGRDYGDTTSVEAFMAQAATYETTGDTWDKILKVFNSAFREHPFNTVRAAELERWRTSGEYDSIIAGGYTRRGGKDRDWATTSPTPRATTPARRTRGCRALATHSIARSPPSTMRSVDARNRRKNRRSDRVDEQRKGGVAIATPPFSWCRDAYGRTSGRPDEPDSFVTESSRVWALSASLAAFSGNPPAVLTTGPRSTSHPQRCRECEQPPTRSLLSSG